MKSRKIRNLRIVSFFISVIFVLSINCRGDTYDVSIEDYLKSNYSEIILTDNEDFRDMNILNKDISGNEVFLTGEFHGNEANYDLQIKFLKYIKMKTNFRYFLIEASYSVAYYLNCYLDTGDIKILEDVYKPLKGTFCWNIDEYNFWKELYIYNKNLADEDKIQIIGVDIENQLSISFKYIHDILSKSKSSKEINPNIEALEYIYDKSVNNIDVEADKVSEICEKVINDLKENESVYKEYLGNNFFQFKYIINNILNWYQSYKVINKTSEFMEIRENSIYENFCMIYTTLPKGIYYGQFGLAHVLQNPVNGVRYFAERICEGSLKLKGKVYSIGYIYDECEFMMFKNGEYVSSPMLCTNTNYDKFKKTLDNKITLYNLNKSNSPFKKKLIWPYSTIMPSDGVFTDYFQSIVVINGYKATEPISY